MNIIPEDIKQQTIKDWVMAYSDSLYTWALTKTSTVKYDNRKRDLDLETNPKFAIFTIDKICSNLGFLKLDNEFILEGNFSLNNPETLIKTSFERELAYCLEHSIHHQALIKIALKELLLDNIIQENFGVAPATIRNNNLIYK